MARISHAVCFADDVDARRAFYERVFRRTFRGSAEPLRCESWFLTARRHAHEPPGWSVYFAAPSIESVVRALEGASVHAARAGGTDFAFVSDPILGALVLQRGGGGDASARFETPDPSAALPRLDRALGIYVEGVSVERAEASPRSGSFATTSGAYLEVPSLARPAWRPAWRAPALEACVGRAVRHGARVLSVDACMGVSVRIADPWGAELVLADEDDLPLDDPPDLASIADAARWSAAEPERAARAERVRQARIAALRARFP